MQNHHPEPALLNQNIDEKLFRLLVANIKDYAVFMIDANGCIMSWNPGATNIVGYREDEIIGRQISVFYIAKDIENNEPRHHLNNALKLGSFESEGWRIRKDGSAFWANVVFTTVYNDAGHLAGFATIVRDITERKQQDDRRDEQNADLEKRVSENSKKIITNELKFRKLIENSYDGIILFDKNLGIIYRSISSENITGWSNTARSELEVSDLVHPDDQEQTIQLFTDILVNPSVPIVSTFRIKHNKGHYVWVECIFTNMLNDKSIAAIVCNFRDITGRKSAEGEIKRKTAQVENILESITEGFIALDTNFCYTYANKKIGEMLDCTPESLIGRNVWDVFPKAVGSHTYKAFNAAMKKQQYICHQDYYAPLNLWQENHIYPSSSGLSVFIRNITEKKMAELEREKITADLVKRNNDLEQFTYIISHNLRSPVANIKGLSDLLNCFDHTDPDCITTLDSLALSVKNLDKVIMDLNQILQTGNQVNDKNEVVSLPVLIAEIKLGLQDMITANNVTICYDFSWIDELYILKSYIYSIFQNLIVNSIKYRRAETDPVIQISTMLKKDKVIISFKDNGKGIDLDKNSKQLFGLYKRFDHSVEGKGMGLFMVKMQVESLGGTIAVDSELGKWTEFKITLAMEKK